MGARSEPPTGSSSWSSGVGRLVDVGELPGRFLYHLRGSRHVGVLVLAADVAAPTVTVMTDYRYAWRNGPRWALYFVRHRRFLAALRSLWYRLACGHIEEDCQDCGRPYLLWHAADDLYGRVTGNWPHPDGESGGGQFCLACFDRRAERQGIVIIWQPEIYPGTSRTNELVR